MMPPFSLSLTIISERVNNGISDTPPITFTSAAAVLNMNILPAFIALNRATANTLMSE